MDDLGFGLYMTLVGMGTVFLLLTLLLLLLMLIGRLDRQPAPPPAVPERDEAAQISGETDPPPEPPGDLSADQLAAVTIAVMLHAEIRRNQAAPVMRAHEPGAHLYASRWVDAGRNSQTRSWRRS